MTKKSLTILLIVATIFVLGCEQQRENIPQYGMFEISFESRELPPFQIPKVNFSLPDGSSVEVDGFYDGGQTYKARAYCRQKGEWGWELKKQPGFSKAKGKFSVIDSTLKGKLKKHPDDPYQFAYDNNEWFLHIGDTGYRYLADTEPKWKEYIDQAKLMGATKIRTWFCRSRHNVEALFNEERTGLNLAYWQEIDKRIAYALDEHPNIILQLIPFGEDTDELKRYFSGDSLSFEMLRYAQARYSAYPNIHWCISNDREVVKNNVPLTGRRITKENINKIGKDMAKREPWGTLITNHQSRFRGYSFIDAPWSDVVTLEDLDQVDGRLILEYRSKASVPVVNDEDRYEIYRPSLYPRYFFRRLMWASLLSGGHATYGGIASYEAYEKDSLRGMQGYFDMKLKGGDDFKYIHKFFEESGLTLVNMQPNDAIAGNSPQEYKCINNDSIYIVYLANPDNIGEPEKPGVKSTEVASAGESAAIAHVKMVLPEQTFSVQWFDPSTGEWLEPGKMDGGIKEIQSPGPGDWVLLISKT